MKPVYVHDAIRKHLDKSIRPPSKPKPPRKLSDYKDTGNLECLVDAANLLMIEFAAPTHPHPHFTPLDDIGHVKTR